MAARRYYIYSACCFAREVFRPVKQNETSALRLTAAARLRVRSRVRVWACVRLRLHRPRDVTLQTDVETATFATPRHRRGTRPTWRPKTRSRVNGDVAKDHSGRRHQSKSVLSGPGAVGARETGAFSSETSSDRSDLGRSRARPLQSDRTFCRRTGRGVVRRKSCAAPAGRPEASGVSRTR